MSEEAPHVFVDCTHHDKSKGPTTGVDFTVHYTQKRATVSILHMPPISDESQLPAFQALLAELAGALAEASRSPKSISWHPAGKPQR